MRKLWLPVAASVLVTAALVGCGGLGSLASSLTGTPNIVAISPNPAVQGSTITLTGTNLDGSFTTVYFSGPSTAQVTAASGNTTSVTAIVPSTLPAGNYSISVVVTNTDGSSSPQSNGYSISITTPSFNRPR